MFKIIQYTCTNDKDEMYNNSKYIHKTNMHLDHHKLIKTQIYQEVLKIVDSDQNNHAFNIFPQKVNWHGTN